MNRKIISLNDIMCHAVGGFIIFQWWTNAQIERKIGILQERKKTSDFLIRDISFRWRNFV